jgi:hypothetical protein
VKNSNVWRRHADRAAKALFDVCDDYGQIEECAQVMQAAALRANDRRLAEILQWVSTNLYIEHDKAVK